MVLVVLRWTFQRVRTDGNLYQGGWSSITGGSNYLNGTYTNVPLTTNGDGVNGKATIVVSGGAVTAVTITQPGTGYEVGDTISAINLNLGNNLTPSAGSGFTITLTEVEKELVIHSSSAHYLNVGDTVRLTGITPSAYDKVDYSVVRVDSNRRACCKEKFLGLLLMQMSHLHYHMSKKQNINLLMVTDISLMSQIRLILERD